MTEILFIFEAHYGSGRPLEASFLQSIPSQDSIVAHEPTKKIDFRNCLVAPKPLPNRRVRRDMGLFQQFCTAKIHGVAARLRAPSTFVLSPGMDRGHALQVSKKCVTVVLQLQWHLELLPTDPIAVFPTRDIPQHDESDVDDPSP
jgi:hypothetical protein